MNTIVRVLALILPLLTGCRETVYVSAAETAAAPNCASNAEGPYRVAHVSDADTIAVRIDGRKPQTVRLIGVDSPEIDGPYRRADSGGVEAKEFVSSLLADSDVYLESDPAQGTHDQYKRRLAYVHRADDCLFINAEIIRNGHGESYRKFRFRHRDLFQQYERDARMKQLGIWSR